MRFRKFFKIASLIISVFLFVAGLSLIIFMNNQFHVAAQADNENAVVSEIFKPFFQSNKPINVMILGGDKVNKNTDTLMVANFNPITSKINIISVPRDTKVIINGKTRKINYAYPSGGFEQAVETVSELLNINIDYYVYIDISAFKETIDLLGGVSLYIPPGMDYDDPTQNLHIHLEEGIQVLNGEKSEQFIRFRHPNYWAKETKSQLMEYYDGSDLKRIEAQQRFLNALIEQKLNIQYISKISSIVDVLFKNIETDFTLNEMLRLTNYLNKIKIENIKFHTLPGSPMDSTPWYYICDIEKTHTLTAEYFGN